MKLSLFFSCCVLLSSFSMGFSQNAGIAKAFSYEHNWDNDINNLHRNSISYQQAIEARNKKIQSTYKQLVDLYNSQGNYNSVSNGQHTVIATNGYDFMEYRNVLVEDSIVTGYANGEGKTINILKGGKITNEKTTIYLENNSILELYFGFVKNEQ